MPHCSASGCGVADGEGIRPEVSEGDQLDVDWLRAYSVGGGNLSVFEYDRPPPGTYQLRVRPVDVLGQPDAAETTLSICILAPWWQRVWCGRWPRWDCWLAPSA